MQDSITDGVSLILFFVSASDTPRSALKGLGSVSLSEIHLCGKGE